jgi:sugar/nucleoside kinase (ribokinase family)
MERFPDGGELLALGAMPVHVGGCAANVGLDLRRQGHRVEMAGCVGDDGAGRSLKAMLGAAGVDTTQITTAQQETSRTVIVLVKGEDRRYLHVFGANSAFAMERIPTDWLRRLDVFYLGGLFAMPGIDTGRLRDALAICRESGVTTVVDVVVPRGASRMTELKPLLPHIDYFLPNSDEAEGFTKRVDPLDQLRVFHEYGARTVVVTLGSKGSLASREGRFWKCPAFAGAGIDPSGAGDAFSAGIIHGHASGWSLQRCLAYASALGLSATREVGTTAGVFTASEAEDFLLKNPISLTEGKL